MSLLVELTPLVRKVGLSYFVSLILANSHDFILGVFFSFGLARMGCLC